MLVLQVKVDHISNRLLNVRILKGDLYHPSIMLLKIYSKNSRSSNSRMLYRILLILNLNKLTEMGLQNNRLINMRKVVVHKSQILDNI